MAIGEGDTGGGGGAGAEDPAKSRRNLLRYGSSGEVAQNVNLQNKMNTDPNPITNLFGITPGPNYGWTGNGGTSPYGSVGFQDSAISGKPSGFWGVPDPSGFGGGGGGPGFEDMPDPFEGLFNNGGGGGGYQGTPIAGAQGLNMLVPGAAERFFADTEGRFKDPTMSEEFAKAQMAKYGAGGPNRAGEAYDAFKLSTPADMSAYYQNAERRAQEQLDKTMAARGLYGSSAAADMTGEMLMNFEADRARNEAGYGLNRATTMGNLGSGADASERAFNQYLAGLAGGADTQSLNRLLGGARVAEGAQNAQTTRGQNMFENQLRMGNALSNTMGEGYGSAFANDKDLFSQWLHGLVGTGSEQQGQATYNAQQRRQDTRDIIDMFGNTSKAYQGTRKMLKDLED